ncbi:hypothetical protein A4A49_55987, partial [Nicotiana attenuata]
PPLQGYYKLNIDGAYDNQSHKGGAVGVFCNDSGAWVYGFTKHLIYTDTLQAELLALYHGLLIEKARNYKPLQVETDSQILLHILSNTPPKYSHILLECREGKQMADALAKYGKKKLDLQSNDVLLFENSPTF